MQVVVDGPRRHHTRKAGREPLDGPRAVGGRRAPSAPRVLHARATVTSVEDPTWAKCAGARGARGAAEVSQVSMPHVIHVAKRE